MITNLITHESVPIGGNNFEEFLSYVKGFLGANFGFSTNVLDNQGGYFEDDAFQYYVEPGPSGEGTAKFFAPSVKPVGNMFGRIDNDYYRFKVLNMASDPPQIHKWEVLLTDSNSPDNLQYRNIDMDQRKLPYRPITFSQSGGYYRYGYRSVRMNGIPQEDTTVSYNYTGNSFAEQSIILNRVTLGAEFPEPVYEGRFDPMDDFTKTVLEDDYDSTVVFSYSNLSTDFGGHILLWREVTGNHLFSYVRQDLSSGEEVSPGRFKVLDYARGVVKFNLTLAQMSELTPAGDPTPPEDIPFKIVSAEQFKEENLGGIGHYYTRYGNVYNGDTGSSIFAEYIFDGNDHIVRHIPPTDYFSSIGDLVLQDVNGRYDDSIILGIKYFAVPDADEFSRVQTTRYTPDTIQLYYHTGIVNLDPDTKIRSVVEQNNSSWYNRDVRDAEYFPVPRAQETYLVYIHEDEASLFSDVFNPNQSFKIVDTIGIADLNDVGTVGPGQVLVFDGSMFEGVDYTLAGLLDTDLSSINTNNVLQYNGSEWVNRSRPAAFKDVEGVMTYNTTTNNNLFNVATSSRALVTKNFVESSLGDLTTSLDPSTIVRTHSDQSIDGNKTFDKAVVLGVQASASGHAVRADRTISTTDGLSGGGDLTSDRTIGINNNAIAFGKLPLIDRTTILGNSTGTDAQDVGTIAATGNNTVLQRVGDKLVFDEISSDLLGDNTITYSKFQKVPGYSVLGKYNSGTGEVAPITGSSGNVLRRTSSSVEFGKVTKSYVDTDDIVITSGTQTIGGNKTFNNTVTVKGKLIIPSVA